MKTRRRLLWGFLVLAILAIGGAAVWQLVAGPEPPPILGEVPAFVMVNRDGRTIRNADLAGAPWVADFIFTRCGASCPMMSLRMARLERSLPEDLGVRFVSFTVDPAHDTPRVLQEYAESFSAPGRWLFLTGDRDALFRLSKEGFKLAVDDTTPVSPDELILHSTRFVLIDGEGRIRGYYEAFDEKALEKLGQDLKAIAR